MAIAAAAVWMYATEAGAAAHGEHIRQSVFQRERGDLVKLRAARTRRVGFAGAFEVQNEHLTVNRPR